MIEGRGVCAESQLWITAMPDGCRLVHCMLYSTVRLYVLYHPVHIIGSFDIQGGVCVDGARDWLYIHAVMLCLIYRMTRVDFIY